jgi:hypothetical protein
MGKVTFPKNPFFSEYRWIRFCNLLQWIITRRAFRIPSRLSSWTRQTTRGCDCILPFTLAVLIDLRWSDENQWLILSSDFSTWACRFQQVLVNIWDDEDNLEKVVIGVHSVKNPIAKESLSECRTPINKTANAEISPTSSQNSWFFSVWL